MTFIRRERKQTSRIVDILVSQTSFKVRQRCRATCRIRHNPQATIDHLLLEKFTESPPDRLHEREIKGFIVVIEINPPANSFYSVSPFRSISHDNFSTLLVVLVNSHGKNVILPCNTQSFVDFMFHWKSMGIPAKSSSDMISTNMRMPSNYILTIESQNLFVFALDF